MTKAPRRTEQRTNERTNEAAESTGERVGVVRRSNGEEGCTKRWSKVGERFGWRATTGGGSEARWLCSCSCSCLPACLPVCLPACLPACFPACLLACLPVACLSASLLSLPEGLPGCLATCSPASPLLLASPLPLCLNSVCFGYARPLFFSLSLSLCLSVSLWLRRTRRATRPNPEPGV